MSRKPGSPAGHRPARDVSKSPAVCLRADRGLGPGGILALDPVANEHEQGFLPGNLTRVDVALQVDARLAGGAHRGGRRIVGSDDEERHGTTLQSRPERRQMHLVMRFGQDARKVHDVLIAAGLDETRGLGPRDESGQIGGRQGRS